MVNKKVKLEMVGLDGNAFALMGAFMRQARAEKWTKEEIDEVMNDMRSGDYDHLLCVMSDHCESPDREEDEDLDEYGDDDEWDEWDEDEDEED